MSSSLRMARRAPRRWGGGVFEVGPGKACQVPSLFLCALIPRPALPLCAPLPSCPSWL